MQTDDAEVPKSQKGITTLRGSISASHNTWAGVMYDEKMYETRQYQITDIVDRVGGGDSFMGGLIYGFLSYGDDNQKALIFTGNILFKTHHQRGCKFSNCSRGRKLLL